MRPVAGAAELVRRLARDGFVVALASSGDGSTLSRIGAVDVGIFVGDTVYDVEAAARAGTRCIALRSGGFGRAELEEAGALRVEELPRDLLDLD